MLRSYDSEKKQFLLRKRKIDTTDKIVWFFPKNSRNREKSGIVVVQESGMCSIFPPSFGVFY